MPIVIVTSAWLKGYGKLIDIDDYKNFAIEILTWPAECWRPIDNRYRYR